METPGPGHYANHTPRVETRPKAPAISFGDHPIVPVEVRQSMKIDLADFHPSDLDPVAAWHKLRGTSPRVCDVLEASGEEIAHRRGHRKS